MSKTPNFEEDLCCAIDHLMGRMASNAASDANGGKDSELDDAVLEFPTPCAQLIRCNPNTGVDQPQLYQLRAWLAQPLQD